MTDSGGGDAAAASLAVRELLAADGRHLELELIAGGASLDRHLAPFTTVHGVLVDVFGVGVLITGASGVGKSECALDLIVRGQRLVADDVVEIRRRAGDILMGSGPELIRHHMELRGLGILNIEDLFGAASIRDRKRVEMVVKLEEWNEDVEYDRLGLDQETFEILDIELPFICLPVTLSRNL